MRNWVRAIDRTYRDRSGGSCGDWDGSFDPVIVPKPKRQPGGVDRVVLSRKHVPWPQGRIIVHFQQVHGIPAPGRDAIGRTRAGRVAGGSASAGEHATGCVEPAIRWSSSMHLCSKVRHGRVRHAPSRVIPSGHRRERGDGGRQHSGSSGPTTVPRTRGLLPTPGCSPRRGEPGTFLTKPWFSWMRSLN